MNPLDLHTLDQKSWAFLNLIGQSKLETWTPIDASGAGLTFTGVDGRYIRVGPLIFAFGEVIYPATVDGSNAKIGGFPFAGSNVGSARAGNISYGNNGAGIYLLMDANSGSAAFYTLLGGAFTNAQLAGATFFFQSFYFT